MQEHRMRVVVPKNHRATIEFPEAIRSGPVELIVRVPAEDQGRSPERPTADSSQGRGRIAALAVGMAEDRRPFRELPLEERRTRLRRLRGIGRGLTSGSEAFARRKLEELDFEERKLAR